MKSRRFRAMLCLATLSLIAACEQGSGGDPTPAPATSTTEAPDVQDYESGPESPIMYGLQVPPGATQLGPLIRYRSTRLIDAYTPELETAQAQRDAEARDKAAEEATDGTPPAPPAPTPEDTRPSDDSFKLLEDPPRPDSTVSLMRVDGKPTEVVRRMLAQIDALLPASSVVTNDLSRYCSSSGRRITSCRLSLRGMIAGDRDVRVTMTVDPGDLATRTSGPSDLTRPVMTLLVEYVGEPREGQLADDTGSLEEVEDIEEVPEKSDLIWPKMDEDAPRTAELLNGWTAPSTATILLSGYRPGFVNVTTARAIQADLVAEGYIDDQAGEGGAVRKDVVEDLNEVSTTYTTQTKDGGTSRAVFVLSARGNYTALFDYPATN
ncbi:hypothetical protein [Aeromicrobium sp.]|uniref:hypothetical protein n=1 Tax=Aeromicrobium sp. TaxID=1871063 RepID=UPI0030C4ED84